MIFFIIIIMIYFVKNHMILHGVCYIYLCMYIYIYCESELNVYRCMYVWKKLHQSIITIYVYWQFKFNIYISIYHYYIQYTSFTLLLLLCVYVVCFFVVSKFKKKAVRPIKIKMTIRNKLYLTGKNTQKQKILISSLLNTIYIYIYI